jgi:ABC-2 type transport system permease protein
MRNIWTIARREYRQFFATPMAYLVAFALLGLLGYLFSRELAAAIFQAGFQASAPGVEIILGPLVWMLLFIMVPALTMRSLADEQRMGTLELLLTAPVRDWELVVGKWFGGLLFVISLLAVTWIYPLVLNIMVEPGIDQGVLVAGYLGLFLMAASLIGIGVAVSSFFTNPIIALVTNYGVVLFLWLLAPSAQGGGSQVISYLNFIDHYLGFFRGVIELSDVVYYLSVTSLALFLATVVVETRRWR